MKKIDQSIRILFIFALVWSILMVVGVPLIVFGASKPDWLPIPTFFFILGIIFSGGGFYGVPLLWVAYGNERANRRLVFAVTQENLLTVPLLAAQLQLPAEQVRERLTLCIQKLYITGYFFDGETLTLNTRTAPSEEILVAECESCGARLEYHPGETPTCPYCGTVHRG